MATISLHRAARIRERIRAAIDRPPPAGTVRLSIFSADPAGEVARHAHRLRGDVERVRRLLPILAALRAAVGCADAMEGVGDLFAEKADVEEEIARLAKTFGDSGPRGTARRRASRPRPASISQRGSGPRGRASRPAIRTVTISFTRRSSARPRSRTCAPGSSPSAGGSRRSRTARGS